MSGCRITDNRANESNLDERKRSPRGVHPESNLAHSFLALHGNIFFRQGHPGLCFVRSKLFAELSNTLHV